MDLITSNRWAVRNIDGLMWLRNTKGFNYSRGKHFVWTDIFGYARLYTRKVDAVKAAKLVVDGEVIMCGVTAFTEER